MCPSAHTARIPTPGRSPRPPCNTPAITLRTGGRAHSGRISRLATPEAAISALCRDTACTGAAPVRGRRPHWRRLSSWARSPRRREPRRERLGRLCRRRRRLASSCVAPISKWFPRRRLAVPAAACVRRCSGAPRASPQGIAGHGVGEKSLGTKRLVSLQFCAVSYLTVTLDRSPLSGPAQVGNSHNRSTDNNREKTR